MVFIPMVRPRVVRLHGNARRYDVQRRTVHLGVATFYRPTEREKYQISFAPTFAMAVGDRYCCKVRGKNVHVTGM